MDKTKVIFNRFIRAFISGAFATAIPLTVANVQTLGDLQTQITLLSISLVIGGINGILLAGDKLIRWKE